ncbi:hypothetical protein PVT67_16305 [Gallaecimonas kandeliae]|uniref:hypothetical protein n=1 Tax=Gallaecimonas kandeliae TaxID=3029055 RepID=UPI002648C4ED|nr:hypothetical protein [Gallaecimonas kandeliae]WKE65204.1 hypothetical protein PVT67_16305 [Gallaecimonas kandeliae]
MFPTKTQRLVALYQIFSALAFLALGPLQQRLGLEVSGGEWLRWAGLAAFNAALGLGLLRSQGWALAGSAVNQALQLVAFAYGGWQYGYRSLLNIDLYYQWFGTFRGAGLNLHLEPAWLAGVQQAATNNVHLNLVALVMLVLLLWRKP